ncbi:MAG: hypothetical protein K2M49_05025 [Muribaculaceae bacterium]|nr:hypothetical protein [Muribaculaceae bacterium]
MKRLYSIMLSAAVAVAASAAIPVSKAPAQLTPRAATEVVSPLPGGINIRIAEPQQSIAEALPTKNRTQQTRLQGTSLQRIAKAPRKADGTGSKYDGTYTLTAGEWYYNTQSQSSVPVQVEMTVEDGVAIISNDDYLVSDIMALFDEETGVMSFVNYYVGANTNHAISFMPFVWNGTINHTTYSVTFNEETQSFDIPADHGLDWLAWDVANIADAKAYNVDSAIGSYDTFDLEGLAKNDDSTTWTSIGTGEWYEGLLTIFSDIDEGQHWSVEIEECDQKPGVYRMKPYAVAGNPIAQLLGKVDASTEVIVNATDPAKVYTDGSFAPFGLRTFCGINKENNFQSSVYGTLEDKVITFPAASFAYYNNGTWYVVNKSGFKIALPGAVVKDYTLKATTTDICSPTAETTVNLTVGADIASLKAVVLPGKYETAYGTNAQIVAANGDEITIGDSFTIETPTEGGIYSIMIVGLDANGDIVATANTYQLVDAEQTMDWEVVTWEVVPNVKATFTEGFLAGIFSDIDAEDFEVVLEESTITPGRFRFEAPYAQHSKKFPVADHSPAHKHYIYVNATDPDKVYVELSPLGVSVPGFGSAYGYSFPGLYAGTANFETVPDSYFGTFANGKINVPALASFNNSPNTANYTASLTLTIDTIAEPTPIEEWKSLGEGTWVDGFFTDWYVLFEGVNNSWTVNIEENTTTPGLYRVLPYASETEGAENLDDADDSNYFLVNATDPEKVFIEGPFTPFGDYDLRQNCAESCEDYDGEGTYGKFVDGEIFFPARSFTEYYEGEAYDPTNTEGILMIVLPGHEVKDYQLVTASSLCGDNGKATINFETVGSGIASIQTTTVAGHYIFADDVEGEPVNVDLSVAEAISHTVDNPVGGNTTLVEALDANGNVRRAKTVYHFNNFDFIGWHYVKEAKVTESCLFPAFGYEDAEITCNFEEKDDEPGMYRIANVYREHDYSLGHLMHNHYLYIDATDPDYVKVIPSNTGVGDDDMGEIYITNDAEYYEQSGYGELAKEFGTCGTMNDNIIDLGEIFVAFSKVYNGAWNEGYGTISIELVDDGKDPGAISEISSDSEADAVYYNIRGQRVARPTVPGIYVRNNTKVYVK